MRCLHETTFDTQLGDLDLERPDFDHVTWLERPVLVLDPLAVDAHAAEGAHVFEQHATRRLEQPRMLLGHAPAVQAHLAARALADDGVIGHLHQPQLAVGGLDFNLQHEGSFSRWELRLHLHLCLHLHLRLHPRPAAQLAEAIASSPSHAGLRPAPPSSPRAQAVPG
jgi:hypothetical protein